MRTKILGVFFDHLSAEGWRGRINQALNGDLTELWVTPNPEMLLMTKKRPSFLNVLLSANASLPDGMGIVVAAKLLGGRVERLSGVDALEMITEEVAKRGEKVMLIGGKGDNAKLAAGVLQKKFVGSQVIGINPGEVKMIDSETWVFDESVMDKIQDFAPQVIAAGLSMGKQEEWLSFIEPFIPSAKLMIGVGGAFEMIAGTLPRAPQSMRRLGFEWLWRLMLEPRRLPRIIRAVIVFPLFVVWERVKGVRS